MSFLVVALGVMFLIVFGSMDLTAGIILPSLQRLHSSLGELDDANEDYIEMLNLCSAVKGDVQLSNGDLDREDECGICLEPCTKMVLPNCCHAMCIKCYRNW